MRFPAALLLLATVVSCASPPRAPIDESAVLEPGVACRASRDGGPVFADRGIGGTGAPASGRVTERGIGGTGVVGVVTGFASVCVNGLEVRIDKTTPIAIDGTAGGIHQLRVGQLVAIEAAGPVTALDPIVQVRRVSVRHEVSGPVEAVDANTGTITVAGQKVLVRPSTWIAGRFPKGSWASVSGLRQADGTLVASRLDPVRTGAVTVHGLLTRDGGAVRIGGLVLQGATIATMRAGAVVSVTGAYRNGMLDVTAIGVDSLVQDPAEYFGTASQQVILQDFARVEGGMVWLSNGQQFKAGPAVQGDERYRNAVVWLKRMADGTFTATEFHYTNYRPQPDQVRAHPPARRDIKLPLPPDVPFPNGTTTEGTTTDGNGDGTPDATSSGVPEDTPVSDAGPGRYDAWPGHA